MNGATTSYEPDEPTVNYDLDAVDEWFQVGREENLVPYHKQGIGIGSGNSGCSISSITLNFDLKRSTVKQ